MQRAIVLSFLLLPGCATIPMVDTPLATVSQMLSDVDLEIISYQEPKMHVATPGDLGPGSIDSLTDVRGLDGSGEAVSLLLARDLAGSLARNGSLSFRTNVRSEEPLRNPQLDANTAVRNSIEVSITVNFLGYRPTAWRTYQYMLHAQARLTDDAGTVVWKKICRIGGSAADETLQFQRSDDTELNRKNLAHVVETAIDRCVIQLAHEGGI